jgi:hypothetical protein
MAKVVWRTGEVLSKTSDANDKSRPERIYSRPGSFLEGQVDWSGNFRVARNTRQVDRCGMCFRDSRYATIFQPLFHVNSHRVSVLSTY